MIGGFNRKPIVQKAINVLFSKVKMGQRAPLRETMMNED